MASPEAFSRQLGSHSAKGTSWIPDFELPHLRSAPREGEGGMGGCQPLVRGKGGWGEASPCFGGRGDGGSQPLMRGKGDGGKSDP